MSAQQRRREATVSRQTMSSSRLHVSVRVKRGAGVTALDDAVASNRQMRRRWQQKTASVAPVMMSSEQAKALQTCRPEVVYHPSGSEEIGSTSSETRQCQCLCHQGQCRCRTGPSCPARVMYPSIWFEVTRSTSSATRQCQCLCHQGQCRCRTGLSCPARVMYPSIWFEVTRSTSSATRQCQCLCHQGHCRCRTGLSCPAKRLTCQ
jgi:hypothetical protein